MQTWTPLPSAIEVGLGNALSRLQGDPPALASATSGLAGLLLFRLKMLTSDGGNATDYARKAEALAQGLRATGGRWMFIVRGSGGQVEVLYALGGDQTSAVARLNSAWPRSEIHQHSAADEIGNALRGLTCQTAMSGCPATNSRAGLDRLVRTLRGRNWAWLVAAEPCAEDDLERQIAWLAREEREVRAEFMRPGTIEAENNPAAKTYIEALQTTREHREKMTAQGGWVVRARLFAESGDA